MRHPLIVAGRPPLRGDDRDLCAGRPRVQGRLGGDGACRQGRPGADRRQPARRLRQLGRAGRGLRGVQVEVNARAASGHPAATGGDARRGTGPAAPAARAWRSPRRSGRPARCRGPSTISYGGVTYSVPHQLVDAEVWVRVDGDEVVATHVGPAGRGRGGPPPALHAGHATHRRRPLPAPPGRAAQPATPKPTNTAEAEFLALGDGARMWLLEAASAGTARVKVKMADAVTLARLHGVERVDWALGHAATYGRFAEGDLASILAAHPAGERRSRRRRPLAAGRHPRLGRLRSTVMTAGAAAAADEVVELLRQLAPAAHAPPRPRRAGHRQSATLGTRRSRPGAARRGARRTTSLLDQHPTGRRRVPHRQDVRHLGRDRVSRSPPRPSGRWPPSSGSTATRTSSCAAPPAPARPTSSKPSATPPSTTAATSSGSASKRSARSCTATAPTAPPPGRSAS